MVLVYVSIDSLFLMISQYTELDSGLIFRLLYCGTTYLVVGNAIPCTGVV